MWNVRGCADRIMIARFSRMMDTASEAMKPVTWGDPRMGRKAVRSITMPTAAPATSTISSTSGKGRSAEAKAASPAKAPMLRMSPWAKLMSRTMP